MTKYWRAPLGPKPKIEGSRPVGPVESAPMVLAEMSWFSIGHGVAYGESFCFTLLIYYLFIYLFINQTLLSATYTKTSGQLYIVRNCSNLNKISFHIQHVARNR